MPTYEYACKACGEHLEIVQSFADDALTECPACEGPLRKVFSSIGISFKGSGFYKTDSRSSSGATATASKPDTKAASSAPSGATGGEAKSEPTKTKTETKADTAAAS
ncbi:MAG TPA: FmdB family zinc ribbon protein [Acidimicrobiales bacterium]|nr:FmdB family zinc ribbon protein [Acidimicrobiales bacterium]